MSLTEPLPKEECSAIDDFVCNEDGCYFPIPDVKTFSDASATCASWCVDAHIAVMNSEEEAGIIRGRLPGKRLWLGWNDQEQEGLWKCSDSSGHTYDEATGFHGQVGYWRKIFGSYLLAWKIRLYFFWQNKTKKILKAF